MHVIDCRLLFHIVCKDLCQVLRGSGTPYGAFSKQVRSDVDDSSSKSGPPTAIFMFSANYY